MRSSRAPWLGALAAVSLFALGALQWAHERESERLLLAQLADQNRLLRVLGEAAWRDTRALAALPDSARRDFETRFPALDPGASLGFEEILAWSRRFNLSVSPAQATALSEALRRRFEEMSLEKRAYDDLDRYRRQRGAGALHRLFGARVTLAGSARVEVDSGIVDRTPSTAN